MINGGLMERIVGLSSLSKNLDNPVANSRGPDRGGVHRPRRRLADDVKLPTLCTALEETLMTRDAPAVQEAFNSDGTQARVATITGTQNVAETLRVTGPSIDSAVISPPQNETLLLRFCFEPLPR